jgi:hypothetical protein
MLTLKASEFPARRRVQEAEKGKGGRRSQAPTRKAQHGVRLTAFYVRDFLPRGAEDVFVMFLQARRALA